VAKDKSVFVCEICGHEALKWIGKCPSCENWNSFQEFQQTTKQNKKSKINESTRPQILSSIKSESFSRLPTGFSEFDRILGGGVVEGSLNLIGGEPGIGKSTLLLQILCSISKNKDYSSLYISGEESIEQIADRARRLGVDSSNVSLYNCTDINLVRDVLEQSKPSFVIIDSIQTLYNPDIQSVPGSMTQIRDTTFELMNIAKNKAISIFVIGHINKDGDIAGPKVLEHMVDGVFYFEGSNSDNLRILRSVKNRFGKANEIAIFEMNEDGLSEVINPSEYFLTSDHTSRTGKAITCFFEGSRGIFVEIQSLVLENKFGNPRRTTQGIDQSRLSMILAVIEKYLGFKLTFNDVYLNVTGGLKISDRDSDLAIVASLLSSIGNYSIPMDTLFIGEIGLSGEVRPSKNLRKKLSEAEKFDYKKIVTNYPDCLRDFQISQKLKIVNVINVREIAKLLEV
jgi:DNA repair protein RadA/Sms